MKVTFFHLSNMNAVFMLMMIMTLLISSASTQLSFARAQIQEQEDQIGPYTANFTSTNEPPPEPRVTTQFDKEPIRVVSELPKSNSTLLGTEPEHNNNWIPANHDVFGTRYSNQTIIGKENVNQLEVKWILNSEFPIEDPPLVIGDKGYVYDNGGNLLAVDLNTGLNLWKVDTGDGGFMHGLTYDNGVLFGGSGHNGTIMAFNATNGNRIWESAVLGPTEVGYNIPTIPLVWNDYVIAGSAGGDLPTFPGVVQGNVTAINRTNGEIIWNLRTTAGDWVTPKAEMIPPNGGGTAWSGFSFDPELGLLYAPIGNATPDFNATSRLTPNYYANNVIAVNITNGQMVWATPFIAYGTVLNVGLPDTHDWDVAFGTSVTKVTYENGTEKKVVIGHDKMGNIIAMDAETGDEIWWETIGTTYRNYSIPKPVSEGGSGEVWPGTQGGVEAFHAIDNNNTLYVATSSGAFNYFVTGLSGYLEPLFEEMENGIGNGTITAIDMRDGSIKWQYNTELPTWVSPLVTNGIVFAGHITEFGYPYPVNEFGAATDTPRIPSGIVLALDKNTGERLWEFNVGAPVGIGGPSVGNGTLLITTGIPAEVPAHEAGSIVAFGLPN